MSSAVWLCSIALMHTRDGLGNELWDNKCASGILSRADWSRSVWGGVERTCCSKECGTCDPFRCHMRPGGAAHCCRQSITSACTGLDGPPPCIYSTKWIKNWTLSLASAGLCDNVIGKVTTYLQALGFDHVLGGTDDRELIEEQQAALEVGAKVVCETGFNAGLSSLAFLCAGLDIKVYSFDLGDTGYHRYVKSYIDAVFGRSRHRLTIGDSVSTLPSAIYNGGVEKGVLCDVAFVDGGHSFPIAMSDILNFANLSVNGGRLLMENCNVDGEDRGGGGYTPVNEAYLAAVGLGIVTHERQISTGCDFKTSLPQFNGRSIDLRSDRWSAVDDTGDCREICVGHFTRGPPHGWNMARGVSFRALMSRIRYKIMAQFGGFYARHNSGDSY